MESANDTGRKATGWVTLEGLSWLGTEWGFSARVAELKWRAGVWREQMENAKWTHIP